MHVRLPILWHYIQVFFGAGEKKKMFQGQITPTRLGSKATPQCVVAVIQRLQPSLVHSLVGWSYVHLGKSIGGSSHDLPRRCRMVTRVAVNAANAASQDSENSTRSSVRVADSGVSWSWNHFGSTFEFWEFWTRTLLEVHHSAFRRSSTSTMSPRLRTSGMIPLGSPHGDISKCKHM